MYTMFFSMKNGQFQKKVFTLDLTLAGIVVVAVFRVVNYMTTNGIAIKINGTNGMNTIH